MISGAINAMSDAAMMRPRRERAMSDRLSISRKLFMIAFVVLIVAYGIGSVGDVRGGPSLFLLSDGVSLLLFVTFFLLFYFQKISQSTALLFCLVEVVRNFYCCFIFAYLQGVSVVVLAQWVQQDLFVTGLVAAVLGLAVNKNISMLFSVLGLVVQIVFVFAFPDDQIIRNLFMFNSFVLTGNLVVVYYHRAMLERLVLQLETSIRDTESLKLRAEALADVNRPFVLFGKNTAGLVHDFRNDVNSMSITAQTMRINHARGKMPGDDDLKSMEKSLANLSRRIDWVRYVTELGEVPPEEWLDIRELVESAIYPFTISPELRGKIAFNVVMKGSPRLWGSRRQYLQIVDNIIRNSCEALADYHKTPDDYRDGHRKFGTVAIVLRASDTGISIGFEDNGPGIPIPTHCATKDCLTCDCFAVGRTTKAHGSGFGMVNVVEAVRAMEGSLKIRSLTNRGTKIDIELPRGAPPV